MRKKSLIKNTFSSKFEFIFDRLLKKFEYFFFKSSFLSNPFNIIFIKFFLSSSKSIFTLSIESIFSKDNKYDFFSMIPTTDFFTLKKLPICELRKFMFSLRVLCSLRYFSLKIAHAFTVFFGTELQLKTKKRGKSKKSIKIQY